MVKINYKVEWDKMHAQRTHIFEIAVLHGYG